MNLSFLALCLLSGLFICNQDAPASILNGPAARALYFNINNLTSEGTSGAIAEKKAAIDCLEQQKSHGLFYYHCTVNQKTTKLDPLSAEKIYGAIPEQSTNLIEAGVYQKSGSAKCLESMGQFESVYTCRIE